MADSTDREFEEKDDQPLPRRRRLPEDDDEDSGRRQSPKTLSVLGLLSLIGGILSLIVSFIPCVGSIAIFSGVVGLAMGAIALGMAGSSNHGKGAPISGIVVNLLSIFIAIIWIFVIGKWGKHADEVAMNIENADAIIITAAQLGKEYETNVVKADETYKGKVVEVTGKVKLVSKERVLRTTVELGNDTNTIDCDFGAATKADLVGIEVGQTATIRGKVKGIDRKSSFVVVENCKLVKNAPPPERPTPIVTDAAKLLKDYTENSVKADKLYKGKYLEVKVEMQRVSNENGQLILRADIGGKNDFGTLQCEFPESAKDELAELKKKAKVTVRGTCEMENGLVTLTDCLLVK